MTFPSFEELIISGGDNRLDLLENGLNKYNVDPRKFDGTMSRASCTCSPFSSDGYQAAKKLYERLSEIDFDEVRNQQADKIKSLLNYAGQDRFHVFFAPSGSDLCYYSLMFSRLIHPDRKIFNIVTCPEELGSGSIKAHHGKFFADRNQFNEPVEDGKLLNESLRVESEMFPARTEQGSIINHSDSIVGEIYKHYHSHSVCANLVIGSKSGIENNTSMVSLAPEDVLWTVDMCQFRASRILLNGLIGMNCSVMLTGSKFYQSPPFCAVMLVPKTITEKFVETAAGEAKAFRKIFSSYDIPPEFPNIRSQLKEFKNYGLLLRWEAALAEMEALSQHDSYDINHSIKSWNKHITDQLSLYSTFELMPGQGETNKTIVSFRVRNSQGDFLSHGELQNMYSSICQQPVHTILGVSKVLFGQPVKYGEKSFIRIALGSSELGKFIRNSNNFEDESKLIKIIADWATANS